MRTSGRAQLSIGHTHGMGLTEVLRLHKDLKKGTYTAPVIRSTPRNGGARFQTMKRAHSLAPNLVRSHVP